MKFEQLVNEIMEYESDTFTASGFELTRAEATYMAERLLDWVATYTDGVRLDALLYELREQVA